jgi:hypothetical protein
MSVQNVIAGNYHYRIRDKIQKDAWPLVKDVHIEWLTGHSQFYQGTKSDLILQAIGYFSRYMNEGNIFAL